MQNIHPTKDLCLEHKESLQLNRREILNQKMDKNSNTLPKKTCRWQMSRKNMLKMPLHTNRMVITKKTDHTAGDWKCKMKWTLWKTDWQFLVKRCRISFLWQHCHTCITYANHENVKDAQIEDILQSNWSVLCRSVKVMKVKTKDMFQTRDV